MTDLGYGGRSVKAQAFRYAMIEPSVSADKRIVQGERRFPVDIVRVNFYDLTQGSRRYSIEILDGALGCIRRSYLGFANNC